MNWRSASATRSEALANKPLSADTLGGIMVFEFTGPEVELDLGAVIVDKLIGVVEGENWARPAMLILRLRGCGWIRCFLSAFLVHWEAVSEEQLADLWRDYAHARRHDLLTEFALAGRALARVTADRSDGSRLVLHLRGARVVLTAVDPTDPHSDTELTVISED